MAPRDDAVYLDLEFADETWAVSVPMPRWVAEGACYDFAQGTPWIDGRRVIRALLVRWEGAWQ